MEKFLAGMQNMLLDGCYFLPFILLLVSSFQREILWLLLCGTVDLVATTALYIGIGAQASAAHRTTRLATISAYAVIFGTTIGGVILTALSGALRLLSDNEWGLFLVLHMSMCGTMTILFLSGAIGDIARLRNEPAEEWDVNSSFREMGGDHTPHS